MFYNRLQKKLSDLVVAKQLSDKEIIIKTHVLKPVEAIGNPDRDDFPLLKGKEVLMEAAFENAKGQAYTDAPSEFTGPLKNIISLDLDDLRAKALFIASLNAVMRYLYPELTTIHCKDNDPEECAEKIIDSLKIAKPDKVGLIGMQPAILEALVNFLGADSVSCVDRDENNMGKSKFGVPVEWGDSADTEKLFRQNDLILATGSTVVNGSIMEILNLSEKYNKKLLFFGTTIAGTARLMNLERFCFKST